MKKMKLSDMTWKTAVSFVLLVIAMFGIFWWITVVPRQQEANLANYEWQVRAACHAQANATVQQQAESLSAEEAAQFNDIAVYELQYTLCRRANGVSD